MYQILTPLIRSLLIIESVDSNGVTAAREDSHESIRKLFQEVPGLYKGDSVLTVTQQFGHLNLMLLYIGEI